MKHSPTRIKFVQTYLTGQKSVDYLTTIWSDEKLSDKNLGRRNTNVDENLRSCYF